MIFEDTKGPSTLGGRIVRARDAAGFTTSKLARQIGVKTETMKAWEADGSEPSANRLLMLSGILGVSPTWLLSGVGEDPAVPSIGSALNLIENRLEQLKQQQLQTSETIAAIEDEFNRLRRVTVDKTDAI